MDIVSVDTTPVYGELIFHSIAEVRKALIQFADFGVTASKDAMKAGLSGRHGQDYEHCMTIKNGYDLRYKDQFMDTLEKAISRLERGIPMRESYGNGGYACFYKTTITARRILTESSFNYLVSIRTSGVDDRVNEEFSIGQNVKRAVESIAVTIATAPRGSVFEFDMDIISAAIRSLKGGSKFGGELAAEMMEDLISHNGLGVAKVRDGRLLISCHIDPLSVTFGIDRSNPRTTSLWTRDGAVITGPLVCSLDGIASPYTRYETPKLVITVEERIRKRGQLMTTEPALIERIHNASRTIQSTLVKTR